MKPSPRRSRAIRRDRSGVAALALLLAGLTASCAEHLANKAGQGAITAIREQSSDDPQQQIMRVAAQRAVEGAVEAVDAPAQRQRLTELASDMADQAVASAVGALDDPEQQQRLRELVSGLVDEAVQSALTGASSTDETARGPAAELAGSMARAATKDAMQEMAAGMGASLEQLFPGCAGPGAEACRRQRVHEMSLAAGAGFTAGVLEPMRWPLLILAGGMGLLGGLLAHWLWTLRSRPRRPLGGHRAMVPTGGRRALKDPADSRAGA